MTGKQAYARDAICLKLAPIPFAFLCLYQGGPGEAGGRGGEVLPPGRGLQLAALKRSWIDP